MGVPLPSRPWPPLIQRHEATETETMFLPLRYAMRAAAGLGKACGALRDARGAYQPGER
jgi:hypothetical protein